jgi:hypothetical protein
MYTFLYVPCNPPGKFFKSCSASIRSYTFRASLPLIRKSSAINPYIPVHDNCMCKVSRTHPYLYLCTSEPSSKPRSCSSTSFGRMAFKAAACSVASSLPPAASDTQLKTASRLYRQERGCKRLAPALWTATCWKPCPHDGRELEEADASAASVGSGGASTQALSCKGPPTPSWITGRASWTSAGGGAPLAAPAPVADMAIPPSMAKLLPVSQAQEEALFLASTDPSF